MKTASYDENSNEMKPLILRGVNVGEYSFGLYSKWYLAHRKQTGVVISGATLGNFVCGLLRDKFDIALSSADDVKKYQVEFKEKHGISIAEWFTEYIENDCR